VCHQRQRSRSQCTRIQLLYAVMTADHYRVRADGVQVAVKEWPCAWTTCVISFTLQVPLVMYLMTHAYFCFYHAVANLVLRRVRGSTAQAGTTCSVHRA
jgi:hypothetical protein